MALRDLGFFLHAQYLVVSIEFHDTCTLQFLYRRLFMTHDAAGSLLLSEIHEFLEAEEQQIICGHHKHVIVNLQLFHCKQQITHSAQSRIVGLCAVIYDGYRLLPLVTVHLPFFEDRGKLMVCHNDMFIDFRNPVDIVDHPVENTLLAYF